MTLAQPLWLLLLPLLGVLLYLHRQRRAHRELEVAGLHLWRRVAAQHAPTRSRLPRWTAALLLQALALLLLLLALARPGPAGGAQGVHTVLLLDASRASRASDLRPSRFAGEVARAGGVLEGRVSVLLVSDTVRPVAARRTDLEAVRRRLEAAAPTDGVARWEAAARTVQALTQPGEQTRVLALVSASEAGRASAALSGLKGQGVSVGLEAFGTAQPNAALTRASLLRIPSGALLLSGAALQTGGSGTVALSLTLNGRPLARQTLNLPAGRETAFEVELPAASSGPLTLNLAPDALDADSHAWFVVRPAAPTLTAAIVGPADSPLSRAVRRALEAIPGVSVAGASGLARAGEVGVQVVTGPPGRSAVNVPTLWLNAASGGRAAPPLAWDTLDPLSQGQDWAHLKVSGNPPEPWPTATPLIWSGTVSSGTVLSGTGPLLEVRRSSPAAPYLEVRANFDVAASGWITQPGFPAFVLGLVREVAPDTGLSLPPPCTVGKACPLDAGPGSVEGPTGRVRVRGASSFVPTLAGVYRQDGREFAVNRFAGPESALTAAPSGLTSPTLPRNWASGNWALWPFLLGLALLVLLAEAVLARRTRVRAGWRPLLLALPATLLLLLALFDVPLPWPERSRNAVLLLPGDAAASRSAGFPRFQVGRDLSAALALGEAALPAGGGHLLVQGGSWLGGPVEPLPAGVVIDRLSAPAVARLSLSGPDTVASGQAFDLTAQFDLPLGGETELRLTRGEETVYQGTRTLAEGEGRINLPVTAGEAGQEGYTLRLTLPKTDATAASTVSASAVVSVQAGGGVLVVGRSAAETGLSVQALTLQGRRARAALPTGLGNAATLAGQEAVLLLDVRATEIPPPQQAALEAYVQGGGLLLIAGGPHSFGPGGYYGTPLERLSPLSSRVVQDAPQVALGLLLDKSGSMNEGVDGGYSKLDLIKAAGIASAELLNPASEVAVVAFDSAPKMVVPLQSARDLGTLRAQVGRIEAEGGTQVMRALSAMLKELGRSRASSKHMILLTDGIDGGIFSAETYGELVGRIRASGITLSTVSVGSGMHVPLMKTLAELGGGSFQATEDWRDVPSLLATDTLRQGRSSVQVGQVGVTWTDASPFPGGSEPGTLGGYVRTTLKPDATLLAQTAGGQATGNQTSDSGPQALVARWRYGLGSVMALAGGLGGWATSWSGREDYPALLSRLLRREEQVGLGGPLTLTQTGSDLKLSAARARGELSRTVTLDGPDGKGLVELRAGGDTLSAVVPARSDGGYVVQDGGQIAALAVGWRPGDLLAPLVARTGGQRLQAPQWPAAHTVWLIRSVWPLWALLGLGLFLLGLASRYLIRT